ncbi:MAG: NADH:flavin oxidoreductase, partial [Chloroflexi bacterium CG08_land_8_20_14_0_20_45_12]
IRTETKAEVMEINEKGVRVRRNGNLEFFEGDTVILAVGMKANNEIKSRLEGKVKQLDVIGDCAKPRRIKEAVEEGFEVGIKV